MLVTYRVSLKNGYPEMQFVLQSIISADASKLFLRNFFVKNLQYVHSKLLESLNAFDIFFSRRQCLNKDDQPVFKNLWDVTALFLDKTRLKSKACLFYDFELIRTFEKIS